MDNLWHMDIVFYRQIPRWAKILIVFVLIILISYLAVFFLASSSSKNIPDEFLKARQEASLIAKDIVANSNQITNNLKEISDLEKKRKYSEALNLISSEIQRSRDIREKALGLSVQLASMAKNISGISPEKAGRLALEAVSSETALINHLITYNDLLSQILENLYEKFINPESDSNGKISDLVKRINEEILAINELNDNFDNLMKEFDGMK